MKTTWTKGLKEDEAKEVKSDFLAANLLFERMTHMLESKMATMDRAGRSEKLYDCPNWTYRQADICGYNRALAEIISLITNETRE